MELTQRKAEPRSTTSTKAASTQSQQPSTDGACSDVPLFLRGRALGTTSRFEAPPGASDGGDSEVQCKRSGSSSKDGSCTAGDEADAVREKGSARVPSADARENAIRGLESASDPMPHLGMLERSFAVHDLSSVKVKVGGAAADAAEGLGAIAYTRGNRVGFSRPPDVWIAAHEAAHVVQQRAGVALQHGIGRTGDPYEQQADAVADAVVRGESAATFLDDHCRYEPAQAPTAAVQTWCDPETQSCPQEDVCADHIVASNLPPLDVCAPTQVSVELEVASAPSIGDANARREIERIALNIPVLSEERYELYAIPVEYVFLTAEQAAHPTCNAHRGWEEPPSPSVDPNAPPGIGPTHVTPTFEPGQRVFALDGPITIVSATADYVVTDVYTAFAVGAGATALVRSDMGNVLVDAGMHQVGGQVNEVLAQAMMQRLEAAVGDEGFYEVMISHMHSDHTNLLPMIYARWHIGRLRVNALQALLPATQGPGTRLEQLAEQMIEARRVRVEGEVRAELTGTFGPWTLFADESSAEAQQAFDAEVQRHVQRQLQAMPETEVHIAMPSGDGQVTAIDMPIGRIGLPSGMRPDASPITRGLAEPGLVTLLDPGAGAAAEEVQRTGMAPSAPGAIDRGSSTYVMNLPNGGRLIVIADQRTGDIVALRSQFEAALAALGQPRTFQIWNMTHHLQHGWVTGGNDAVMRVQQLREVTRVLSDIAAARRQQGGAMVGNAVIVSVHGSPDALFERSLVDPAVAWILDELDFRVFPATGGGSVLTAARDVQVLEVTLDSGERVPGVVSDYPSLRPSTPRIGRAHAALRLLEGRATQLTAELRRQGLPAEERSSLEAQLRANNAEHATITAALDAYIGAVDAEIGRSTRRTDPTHARPAVIPATGGTAPAGAQAMALDVLLVQYTDPVVGPGEFTPSALVVIGHADLARLSSQDQGLLAAQERVQAVSARLRWSSPPEVRTEAAEALETYRTRIMAAIESAPEGSRAILHNELAHVETDLTVVTGFSPAQLAEMREATRLADQVANNVVRPMQVESVAELTNGATASRIQSESNGLAVAQGQLYRVSITGDSVSVSLVSLAPVRSPRTSSTPTPRSPAGPPMLPPTTGTPTGAGLRGTGWDAPLRFSGDCVPRWVAQHPNILNFSGRTVIVEQQVLEPTASQSFSQAQPGEVVIIGFSNYWVVADMRTRQPIAGAFQGGEWWRMEADGTWVMEVDATGNVRQPRTESYRARIGDQVQYGRRMPLSETGGPGASGPGGGVRVAAGVMAIIMIANEILAPLGRSHQIQRYNIERARARLRFWIQFGANPTYEMRTANDEEIQPATTQPDTSVFGQPIYHYVTNIDVTALASNLEANLSTYQNLLLWLDTAAMLGTVQRDPPLGHVPDSVWGGLMVPPTPEERRAPRRYYALIDGPAGPHITRRVDITSAIDPIEQRTLAALDETMRARVGGWPEERRANVFRLRDGSATRLYRAGSGQPIRSAAWILGPDPWVCPIGPVRRGRTKVVPANADAERSALVSAYQINRPIWEVRKEVEENDREVLEISPEDARGRDVQGFVAGPRPGDPRFGLTRYFRHPQHGDIWTVAIGELNEFWVNSDELEPVSVASVNRYVQGAARGSPR